MGGFLAVGHFLIALVFSIIIMTLWLRIGLRFFKISVLNPVNRLICSITDPVIAPINRTLRIRYKPGQRYDLVAFILLVLAEVLKFTLISFLAFGKMMPWSLIALYMIGDMIVQLCNLFFYMILIRVIMSWIKPGLRTPLSEVLSIFTDPLIRFGRRIVPNISGFDFSPYIIALILMVITLFIKNSYPWPFI